MSISIAHLLILFVINLRKNIEMTTTIETTNLLKDMNAAVTEKIYVNMGQTINQDEIDQANKLLFAV